MSRPHIVTGIDIGNSQVKVVIAIIENAVSKPRVLGYGSSLSNGLRKGMVVDMEETVNNIRSAIQKAEAIAGVTVKKVYLAVNGLHINTQSSRGVIAVSRADNEISQNEIDRVISAASVVSLPPNREIIHVIPQNYVIDGTENVKNPLGMKGVRLEVDALIIHGLSPYLRNLVKCINENNIEVSSLVYAPLASSIAVLDKKQKEYGVINIDFGGEVATLTVFEESDLLHSVVLPIGSRRITDDLAVFLRTSLDVAEKVKLKHGATSNAEDLRRSNNIDLSEDLNEDNFVLPKKQLVRVIDARVNELFDIVNNELKKVSKNSILPAGVVLCGGGSNLPGLTSLVKDRLRLPVKAAKSPHFEEETDILDDPSFSVSLGLILWGVENDLGGNMGRSSNLFESNDIVAKTVGWLKNFLP